MNADWPLSAGTLHLNHGSFGAVPRVALAAQAQLRAEMESAPVRWFAGSRQRLATTARDSDQGGPLSLERQGDALIARSDTASVVS
ncbi:hypothetical protein J2S43_004557 [Catenuloplanes nepalensis]|uniref:Uncharacterized protein n=1 Tax=Catenuloplanes nepalensis TaxID=587533 RepID=A0ABT9MX83_9ACTN|nr:hypothetical protein [Catenuloplanes nepalensis]MDP9796045.1 hypothetical protein [Catenuloplanes nepalensis]